MGRTTEAVVDYDDYHDLEKSRDKWRYTAIFFMSMVGGIFVSMIYMGITV